MCRSWLFGLIWPPNRLPHLKLPPQKGNQWAFGEGSFIREAPKRAFAHTFLSESTVLVGKHSAELDVWIALPRLKLRPVFTPCEMGPCKCMSTSLFDITQQ